jgi:8-oxo-dGTP diphosphatase
MRIITNRFSDGRGFRLGRDDRIVRMDSRDGGRVGEPRRVALAIVIREGKALVARRRSGDEFDGLWEFPGGKIEAGESPEAAAVRECWEELGCRVTPLRILGTHTHDYRSFRVELNAVLCAPDAVGGTEGRSQAGSRWVDLEELRALPMPAGNAAFVESLSIGGESREFDSPGGGV